ncbi:trans-sulfuration enzyme family protein, partial [Thermodesulfobacteriota bacterium]
TFTSTDADSVCEAVKENTKVVVIESPTNPLLNVLDVRKVAESTQEHDLVTVLDNTFATPICQNPINMGIDIVVHSGTKYLGGHSDICCGFAVANKEKAERVRALARHLGGSLNAFTCYLLERSLKTLAIRVQRQCENALRIAEALQDHPAVRRVNYPGLSLFNGHAIAESQMQGFGGMLSFELDEKKCDALRFVRKLKLIRPAVSLGGIETTICSPAVTSHSKISAEERERIGITDSLLRLSVGIEQVEDLIADLKGAFD